MALTDLACKNAKPKEKPYKLADSQGLYLSVHPNGSKYWRMNYRFLGKQKSLSLGVYPEVPLGSAREQCQAARKLLAAGTDPSQAKKETKRLRQLNAANTFEAVGREWLEHYREKWSANHAGTILRRLEQDVFPEIGYRPIKDLKAADILTLARKIESRGAYEMTRRAMQICSQIFRYAVITNRAEYDPVPSLIRRAAKKIKDENPAYEGDLGFKVFKLASSNIKVWNPDRTDLEGSLLDHKEHLVEGRSEQDILYELLLKRGVDLTTPIETREITGKNVYSIGFGKIITCLDDLIAANDVEPLASGIIAWQKELKDTLGIKVLETHVFFKDSAFRDDVAKTNMAAILSQNGIDHVRSL